MDGSRLRHSGSLGASCAPGSVSQAVSSPPVNTYNALSLCLSFSLSVCVVIGRRSLSLKSPRTSVSVWVIGHVTRYLEHRYLFSPDWAHPCLQDLHVGTEPAIVCDRTLCTGTSARLDPILLVPVLEQTSRDVHISLSPTFCGFCYLSGADLSIPRAPSAWN